MSDKPNDELESDNDAIAEFMGYNKWPKDVAIAFERVRGVASLKNLHVASVGIVGGILGA